MHIMPISMTSNIQPGNRPVNRNNNVRFAGNTEQSEQPQQDSFTPAAKSKEVDVYSSINRLGEILIDPEARDNYKKHTINFLKRMGVDEAKEGNFGAARAVTEKLMSFLEKPELQSGSKPELSDFTVNALIEIFENSDMKSLKKVLPSPKSITVKQIENLRHIANKVLDEGKPQVTARILTNLTDIVLDSRNPDLLQAYIKTLDEMGDRALSLKRSAFDAGDIPVYTNNDEATQLVINQLGKIATNPKLDRNGEIFSNLEENLKQFNNESMNEHIINEWKRATKDLEDLEEEVEITKGSKKEKEMIRIKCKEKVREFDKAFKQENLEKLDEDSKEKLYIDLDSTIEKLKKIYKKKLKTELKYIIQRYRDYVNYFENRGSSETLIAIGSKYNDPCFHPLQKGNQILTHDIVALISKVDNPKKDGRKSAIDILGNVSECLIKEAKKIK